MKDAYLIAGAGGMLGTALQRVLTSRGVPFTAPAERGFDITDQARVDEVVRAFAESGGRILVNAAAYTDVERAEAELDVAYRVNETGARILAEAACAAGLRFVHISTDFVFDGEKEGAYVEDDAPNPLSVYGASKLAGEQAVLAACPSALVVRTAWVFGPNGRNFPVKIMELAASHESLSVVTDEVGSPTFTMDLATGILGLVEAKVSGVIHLAGSGSCSRFELANETLRLAGMQRELVPVTSSAFPTSTRRPANSVLECARAASVGVTMPHWRDALARFVGEEAM